MPNELQSQDLSVNALKVSANGSAHPHEAPAPTAFTQLFPSLPLHSQEDANAELTKYELAKRLIQPVFLSSDGGSIVARLGPRSTQEFPIEGHGGIAQLLARAGVSSVALYGIPSTRDELGKAALTPDSVVSRGIRAWKEASPTTTLITDLCVCQYVPHGHCRLLRDEAFDREATLEHLLRQATHYTTAGCDVLMPSGVLPGAVKLLREEFSETPIIDQASKFQSSLYRPFQSAAFSRQSAGVHKPYQIPNNDPARAFQAMNQSLSEGADALVLKPALGFRSTLQAARKFFPVPLIAFITSGEHNFLSKLITQNGYRPYERALSDLIRDGADLLVSYRSLDYLQSS